MVRLKKTCKKVHKHSKGGGTQKTIPFGDKLNGFPLHGELPVLFMAID
jgi:hypothetical protein